MLYDLQKSTLMRVCLNCIVSTNRERFLADGLFPGINVLENALGVVDALDGVELLSAVTNDAALTDELRGLGVQTISVPKPAGFSWRWQDAAVGIREAFDTLEGPVLVVSPFAGVVADSVVNRVLYDFRECAMRGVSASAIPVPSNSNPSWMHHAPRVKGTEKCIRQCKQLMNTFANSRSLILAEEVQKKFGKVLGSQWLCRIYKMDGCVVAMESLRMAETDPHDWRRCVAETEPATDVFAYKLPIWTAGEDVALCVG